MIKIYRNYNFLLEEEEKDKYSKIFNKKKNTVEEKNINYKNDFRKYRNNVSYHTKKQPLHLLKNFNLRNKNYHIDHIISVYDGFRLKIPEKEIANISNLRIIEAKENLKKGKKSIFNKNNKHYLVSK